MYHSPPNAPPLQAATKHRAEFPVVYSRTLLVIHFKDSSVYMPIPNSLFPILLTPLQWDAHIRVQLMNNVVMVAVGQQRDSAIHIHLFYGRSLYASQCIGQL